MATARAGLTLAPGAACAITITFTPVAINSRRATWWPTERSL
jgi:hypothetical protein